MYYIYVLYSKKSDCYYVDYSNNPQKRLIEHNSSPHHSFTSKHRPWELKAYFEAADSKAGAIQIERFIKQQKSRRLIEKLCNPEFAPTGKLGRLVRVSNEQG